MVWTSLSRRSVSPQILRRSRSQWLAGSQSTNNFYSESMWSIWRLGEHPCRTPCSPCHCRCLFRLRHATLCIWRPSRCRIRVWLTGTCSACTRGELKAYILSLTWYWTLIEALFHLLKLQNKVPSINDVSWEREGTAQYKVKTTSMNMISAKWSGIKNASIWRAYFKISRAQFWDMATLTPLFWQN